MPDSISLKDLEAEFIQFINEKSFQHIGDDIGNADGVMFLCPKCFRENNGPIGTHMVICWFLNRGVPDSMPPGPGRWSPHGTGLGDLELKARSSSILLTSGCRWHGFVRGGRATLG